MGVPSWRPQTVPAKRKQCTGHVPSPELQLNPPWEDTPDFRSKSSPQQMFSTRAVGGGVLSFKPCDSVLMERKFSNLNFQIGVGLCGPVRLPSFLPLEDNRMYLKDGYFSKSYF